MILGILFYFSAVLNRYMYDRYKISMDTFKCSFLRFLTVPICEISEKQSPLQERIAEKPSFE